MIILVLHPWPIVREGLRQVLTLELGESTELLEPKDLDQAMRWVDSYTPRLALVNPRAYPRSVLALVDHLPVIVYTESVNPDEIAQSVRDGASGWVNVQDDLGELVNAIAAVQEGVPVFGARCVQSVISRLTRIHQEYLRSPTPLAPRELEVLRLLARGYTDKEIAGVLTLAAGTVSNTVSRTFVKLGVHNRVEATLRALEAGLVNPKSYRGGE